MHNQRTNLLDASQEPADEALAALMRAVAEHAHDKREQANARLWATLEQQVNEVRTRYGIVPTLQGAAVLAGK